MSDTENNAVLVACTADIVSAYVGNNAVRGEELGDLIARVHGALATLGSDAAAVENAVPQAPAVPVKRSVTPDYLICLDDGKKFKSLKRHLRTSHGMTPEEYRQKWNLPADYPMVAPNYAASRSALAKSMGLGRPPRSRSIVGGGDVSVEVAGPTTRRRSA